MIEQAQNNATTPAASSYLVDDCAPMPVASYRKSVFTPEQMNTSRVRAKTNYLGANPNLYCQTLRVTQKKDKLGQWRQQMQQLEDSKSFHLMYERIGRDKKTLAQEREQARKSNGPAKRKYKDITRSDDDLSAKPHFAVAVAPQNAVDNATAKQF
jgi:hypothetical protein